MQPLDASALGHYLDVARASANRAAALLAGARPERITSKSNPHDLVTEWDLASEAAIRAELVRLTGERAGAVPILYGGSVNRANVESLIAVEDVDGVLVGGASLDADQWLTICRS